MQQRQRTPLLVICGPTATGKTEMAVRVAERLGGEIISVDSMQVYRHLDIGTAKPTAEQRRRAVFHLVDIVEPDEPYNVALFQKDARAALEQITGRGKLPILCGGTGLYLRAVIRGFDFPAAQSPEAQHVRRALQAQLAEIGNEAMHQRLRAVDPQAAARIAVADSKRIIRALEVYELTGRPFSVQQRVDERQLAHYNVIGFALTCPRPLLYQRIDARVEQMIRAGWVQEVRSLLDKGYDPSLPALQAIGYRHLIDYVLHGGNLSAIIELIKRDTRRFAKRQLTWFRRESGIKWLQWTDAAQFDAALQTIIAAVCSVTD